MSRGPRRHTRLASTPVGRTSRRAIPVTIARRTRRLTAIGFGATISSRRRPAAITIPVRRRSRRANIVAISESKFSRRAAGKRLPSFQIVRLRGRDPRGRRHTRQSWPTIAQAPRLRQEQQHTSVRFIVQTPCQIRFETSYSQCTLRAGTSIGVQISINFRVVHSESAWTSWRNCSIRYCISAKSSVLESWLSRARSHLLADLRDLLVQRIVPLRPGGRFRPLDAAVGLTSRWGPLLRRSAARPGKDSSPGRLPTAPRSSRCRSTAKRPGSPPPTQSQRCAGDDAAWPSPPAPLPTDLRQCRRGELSNRWLSRFQQSPESRSRLRATTRFPDRGHLPTSPRRQSPAPAIVAVFRGLRSWNFLHQQLPQRLQTAAAMAQRGAQRTTNHLRRSRQN